LRPRLLNLSGTPSQNAYELHLTVKSKIGVLHQITGFLAEANIDILSMHIQATRGKTADIVAYLETGESDMSMEELLKEVEELDFVQEADAVRKDKVIFEEFLFPIMIDDDVRGFLMTDHAWMSMATRLVLTYGTGGLAILHEAGVACGEEYAKHLQSKLGLGASAEVYLENLEVMLRAAGLGITEMRRNHDGFDVNVREPITQATETRIHDHFLTGVIAGATGHLFATSYSVENVRFQGNELGFFLGGRRLEAEANDQQVQSVETTR
jgi:predicted amino acid-binding ACT domain protein